MRTTFLLAATLLFPALAHAGTWQLDPTHSRVGFRVSHMMVSSVEGTFDDFEGTIDHEVGKLSELQVRVTVKMDSVDTENVKRDDHLRASDFLDVANHPTMTFESSKVEAKGKDAFAIHGDLTLRGVTLPVVLEGKGLGTSVVDPWGNERVGASATTTIDRQDFGVSWNQALEAGGVLVGDEIEIRIDAEFTRPKS